MSRYDDILSLISEAERGPIVYPWVDPKDILAGIAKRLVARLGCTIDQFDYVGSKQSSGLDEVVSEPFVEGGEGTYVCGLNFYYVLDNEKSAVRHVIFLTKASKDEFVEAHGDVIGSAMAENQAAGRAEVQYVITAGDESQFITPGNVHLGDIIDHMINDLKGDFVALGLERRRSTGEKN